MGVRYPVTQVGCQICLFLGELKNEKDPMLGTVGRFMSWQLGELVKVKRTAGGVVRQQQHSILDFPSSRLADIENELEQLQSQGQREVPKSLPSTSRALHVLQVQV